MRTVLPALEASSEYYRHVAYGNDLVTDPYDSIEAMNWVGRSWSFGSCHEVTRS